jgi:tripartite-type tricarboxylate transporter receptor subunit TctC
MSYISFVKEFSMKNHKIPLLLLISTLLALAIGNQARAQDLWPTRSISWLSSAGPGSSPDIIARLLGDKVGQYLGQAVVIENRPGAAGNIAAQAAVRAPADGYNFFFAVASTLAFNPWTFKSLPFDAERDFVVVSNIGVSPSMIAVNPALPIHSMQDLIDYARKNPGKLTFATPGIRNLQHITGELLKVRAGIDMLNVPYKGSPAAAQDTIGGRTDIFIDSVPAMSSFMEGGRLRVIAVTSKERLPGYENIPTVNETLPDFVAVGWFALVAPAGTPADVVVKMNEAITKVSTFKEIAEALRRSGMFGGGGTPKEAQEFVRAERKLWGEVIRSAGIQPE